MSETNSKFDPKRANDNNPNNEAFWISRGYSKRPKDWKQLAQLYKDSESTSSIIRANERFDPSGGYDYPIWKDDY